MSTNAILSDRDINAPINDDAKDASSKPAGPTKSLDYHRQMLQSKLSENSYVISIVCPLALMARSTLQINLLTKTLILAVENSNIFRHQTISCRRARLSCRHIRASI